MQKKKKLFARDPEEQTGFWRFMTILFAEFLDLIRTNMLFLVVGIAVVTIPAATAGMAGVTLNMMEGKNHFLRRDFFDIFRRKFLRSLGVGAVFATAGGFAVLSAYMYTLIGIQNGSGFFILTAIAICILILEQMIAAAAFPLLALTDLTFGKLFLEAKNIAFGNALRSFAAAFINLSIFIVSFLLNPASIIFTLFIEFSFMSFIASYLLYPALKPYLDEAKAREGYVTGETAGKE